MSTRFHDPTPRSYCLVYDLRPLIQFVINFMIVSVMFVCNSFLISMCMFMVSNALLILGATVTVCEGGGEPFV